MPNYEIPIELLNKHNMVSLAEYKSRFGDSVETEETFYKTFLQQTDYICNKIVEGIATWEDYTEEKIARGYARDQLSNGGGD